MGLGCIMFENGLGFRVIFRQRRISLNPVPKHGVHCVPSWLALCLVGKVLLVPPERASFRLRPNPKP